MKKVFIIAEAGVNHNGSLKMAKGLVDAAKRAGADAVKFQTFKADAVVVADAPKAAYQRKTTERNESQRAMLKKLELSYEDFAKLADYCRHKKVMFLSTPFDIESLAFLNRLKMKVIKIPSGELTNLPMLRAAAQFKKKVILSTGMATLKEVAEAVGVLQAAGLPKSALTVLHCHTDYPTRFFDVNLKAMLTLKDRLGVQVGYSDHTMGIEAAIAAVALGASVIEKHFTLDRLLPGPDQKTSLDPQELKCMVESIRHVEQAMGNGNKVPTSSELAIRGHVRRSIVASCFIKKGEEFTSHNVTVKRPSGGISPMRWDSVIGQVARRDFKPDEPIVL